MKSKLNHPFLFIILICFATIIMSPKSIFADTLVTEDQIDKVIAWANRAKKGYSGKCGAYVFDSFSENGYNFFPSSRAACAYGSGFSYKYYDSCKDENGNEIPCTFSCINYYGADSMLELVNLPLKKTSYSEIPRGAIVFYGRDDLNCAGHIGIYDGNGNLCDARTGSSNTGCRKIPDTVGTNYCWDKNGNRVTGTYTSYQGWSFWKGYDLYSEKGYGTVDLNGVLDGINNGGIHGFGTVNVYLNDSLVAESVGDYWNSTIPEGTTYRIDNIKAYNGFSYDGVAKGSLTGTIAADSTIDVQLKFNTIPASGRSAENATLWAEQGITGDDNIIGTINGYNYRDNAVTLSYLVFDAYHIKRVTQPNDFVASGTIKIQNTEDAGSTNMPEGWNKAPRGAILVWKRYLAEYGKDVSFIGIARGDGTMVTAMTDYGVTDSRIWFFNNTQTQNQGYVYQGWGYFSNSNEPSPLPIVDPIVDSTDFVVSNGVLIQYNGGNKYSSITIPDGVTAIADDVFRNNEKLIGVTIPHGVVSIGNNAFSGCINLTNITIPDSVLSVGANAFQGCTSLYKITIPGSIKDIPSYAFLGCTGLVSVDIYTGVETIGIGAFRGCTGLTSLAIPASIKTIGEQAFVGCTSLNNIKIPYGVEKLDYGAFSGCTGLTYISIPNSVTTIEGYVFAGCTSLEKVILPSNLTIIMHQLFQDCSNLSDIVIPDKVTSIRPFAFDGCKKLATIIIPNSVTSIEHHAFWNCSNLTFITFPASLTSIGEDAIPDSAFDNPPNWYSVRDQTWYSPAQVMSRTGIADTYLAKIAGNPTVTPTPVITPTAPVETKGKLVVSSEKAAQGREAVVKISLTENPGIIALTLGFNYDKTRLSYAGFEDAGLTGWSVSDGNMAWIGDANSTYNGEILKLKFKVLDTAADGDAVISLTCGEGDMADANENSYIPLLEPGKVTVMQYIPGDMNGDSKVNALDLVRLKRYLGGENVQLAVPGDVTNDGKINALDLVRLKRFLGGENVVIY